MRRRFGPGRPDSVWAGDITFVPTAEGWLYLAAVLDVGSRRLIGYSMAADMPARLAVDALDTAAPSDTSISKCCDDPLNLVNISRPTSRLRWRATGCASQQAGWGTARCDSVCESFFASLKRELVHQRRFATRDQARREIFAWIARYNTQRLHSTLDYQTPTEWEQHHTRKRLEQAA